MTNDEKVIDFQALSVQLHKLTKLVSALDLRMTRIESEMLWNPPETAHEKEERVNRTGVSFEDAVPSEEELDSYDEDEALVMPISIPISSKELELERMNQFKAEKEREAIREMQVLNSNRQAAIQHLDRIVNLLTTASMGLQMAGMILHSDHDADNITGIDKQVKAIRENTTAILSLKADLQERLEK